MTRHGGLQHLSPRLAPVRRHIATAAARPRARASARSRPQLRGACRLKEAHVTSRTKRQPQLYKLRRLTPAQIAAVQKVARIYREEWRKEVAANAAAAANGGDGARRRNRDEAAERAAFASAIARAEFGRNYWDKRKVAHPGHPAWRTRVNGKAVA